MALIDDLQEECDELFAFVSGLSESDWRQPTAFWAWTTFDQVMHLLQVDRFALASLAGPDVFAGVRDASRQASAAGVELSAQARSEFGQLSKAELLARWRDTYLELAAGLAARDPSSRLSWFGPDMGVSSMVAARQMEVWAHGQDVYDLFCVVREPGSRLRNICDLGVRTFGWSFQNRGLDRPGPAPNVVLAGPLASEWRWNEGSAESVSGRADDFALVVTQRRNVEDTGLACVGAGARAWMSIAQCFAGPPAEAPAPGERAWRP